MQKDIDVQSVKRYIDFLHPYKQYDSEIIDGVIEGLIDSDTLGFEDYPCEMTMKRWREEIAMEFAINPHFLQAPI